MLSSRELRQRTPSPSGTIASSDSDPLDSVAPLRRPRFVTSLLSDGALAIGAHFGASWLRFSGGRFETFLPGVLVTLPWILAAQIAGLVVVGAYAHRPRFDWFLRVILGVLIGTAAGAALFGGVVGFGGVSRGALAADALLLSVFALGWRGAWAVRTRARMRAQAELTLRGTGLVDRATEMATLGSVVRNLYGYRELLTNLVRKDLKLKYRGSVFGFLWSLANPLLMIVVYSIAFTYIMRLHGERFVFHLMLGMLSWTFFSGSAMMSTGSIVDNAALLKSVLFPRAILPIGTVLFNLAQFALTLAVFLPAMLVYYRVPPAAPMLLFPIFIALQAIFTMGVALLLSALTAQFRDIRHLLEVGLAMLFWTTPIVYELSLVPDSIRLLVLLSPVAPFIVAYQQMFYYGHWPEPTVWLLALVYAFGTFTVGTLVFLAAEHRFTEQL